MQNSPRHTVLLMMIRTTPPAYSHAPRFSSQPSRSSPAVPAPAVSTSIDTPKTSAWAMDVLSKTRAVNHPVVNSTPLVPLVPKQTSVQYSQSTPPRPLFRHPETTEKRLSHPVPKQKSRHTPQNTTSVATKPLKRPLRDDDKPTTTQPVSNKQTIKEQQYAEMITPKPEVVCHHAQISLSTECTVMAPPAVESAQIDQAPALAQQQTEEKKVTSFTMLGSILRHGTARAHADKRRPNDLWVASWIKHDQALKQHMFLFCASNARTLSCKKHDQALKQQAIKHDQALKQQAFLFSTSNFGRLSSQKLNQHNQAMMRPMTTMPDHYQEHAERFKKQALVQTQKAPNRRPSPQMLVHGIRKAPNDCTKVVEKKEPKLRDDVYSFGSIMKVGKDFISSFF